MRGVQNRRYDPRVNPEHPSDIGYGEAGLAQLTDGGGRGLGGHEFLIASQLALTC